MALFFALIFYKLVLCQDIFGCTKDVNTTLLPWIDANNGSLLGYYADVKFAPMWSENASFFGWSGCNFLMPVCEGLAKGTNKSCILQSSICDGYEDCDDGLDENPIYCHTLKTSMMLTEIDKMQNLVEWDNE